MKRVRNGGAVMDTCQSDHGDYNRLSSRKRHVSCSFSLLEMVFMYCSVLITGWKMKPGLGWKEVRYAPKYGLRLMS